MTIRRHSRGKKPNTRAMSHKKIVVIGGGTGVFTILSALKHDFDRLTAIVTMADDGGSTGILREEFGILPPGDLRRALIALSHADNKMLADLFAYRFQEGAGLSGHNFGNLFITALHRLTNDFERAIAEAGKMLQVRGQVIPVTLTSTQLVAELADGQVVRGETNLDIPKHDGHLRISRIWLQPTASANPNAIRAIKEADLVIIGPGDLFTSIIPNLLVAGIPEALRTTRAKVAYFVNVMTKLGETHGFSASDFVRNIEAYLGTGVLDYVVLNDSKPAPARLKPYIREHAEFVEPDTEAIHLKKGGVPLAVDLIRSKGYIRHDPKKVLRVVKMIV
ncbi:MAG: YvcK family protein [Patescibacteria group bacterium]|nr:YvcK family protein [Patescibacteria group bacterium]